MMDNMEAKNESIGFARAHRFIEKLCKQIIVSGRDNARINIVFAGDYFEDHIRVAGDLGRALCKNGVLRSGHVIDASMNEWVAPYLENTKENICQLFDLASGGVLLVKDLPAVAERYRGVLDAFTEQVQNCSGRLCIILSGPLPTMKMFLSNNRGLSAYFAQVVLVEDERRKMVKCPVCKENVLPGQPCANCGFQETAPNFINKDDAMHWENTVVNQYRLKWLRSLSDFDFDDSCRELVWYKGNAAHVRVPYGVQKIGAAFKKNQNLRHVTLPSSVIEIGHDAFYLCKSLQTVDTPPNLTTIHQGAFTYCKSLTIKLPASVTEIGEGAFAHVQAIYLDKDNRRYRIHQGMLIDEQKKVLIATFSNGILSNIVVPEYVERIGDMAFMRVGIHPNSIKLPNGLKSIGYMAMVNAACEPTLIPASVSQIGSSAFALYCKDILLDTDNKFFVKVNNLLIEKESGRILSVCNKNAPSIAIPPVARRIDERAFAFCDQLSEIEMTPAIREIGVCAFQGCKHLRRFVIPNSVLRIGYGAFTNCEGLETIYCEAHTEPHGWHKEWKEECSATVYWGGEWKYIPAPILNK